MTKLFPEIFITSFQAYKRFYTQVYDTIWYDTLGVILIFWNLRYVSCERFINVTTNELVRPYSKWQIEPL